jgi:hypothetical protein
VCAARDNESIEDRSQADPASRPQEYHDVNRTYNDVAQALSQYPSLSPKTDVHSVWSAYASSCPPLTNACAAFPNGSSALLLHLSGTIPVLFRGATYRFPISLWVPHAYPREPPLVYVTPTDTMVVRPGQHVDPQGQVYHPYLVGWSTFWDVCWNECRIEMVIKADPLLRNPPSSTSLPSCKTSLPRSPRLWPASRGRHHQPSR